MKIETLILFSVISLNYYYQQNMENIELKKYEGLWQFNMVVPDSSNQATSSGLSDQYTFLIKNGLITMSLLSDNLTSWKSDDDVYVLKTRWQSNTLLYLPPFGDWTPLADYDGEVFYMSDGKQKKLFKKITESEVVVWNKDILKKDRLPFDYEIHKNNN